MDKDDVLIRSNSLSRIGASIRTKRIMLGWTMRDLSRVANVSPTTISALENGSRGTELSTLIRVMTCLGLQMKLIDVDGFCNFDI